MRAASRRAPAAVAFFLLFATHAIPAGAIGVLYPDHVALVSGARGDVVAGLTSRPRSWSVEVSERELFDDVGLRVTGARCALARGRWRVGVEAAQMSAGVGAETRGALRIERSEESWLVEVGAIHDTAGIGDVAPAHLTSVDVRTGVSLAARVHVGCDVEGLRVAGISNPGADVVTSVVVSAVSGSAVTCALVVDRWAGAHARVSAAVRLAGCTVVIAGYDDESASLSLAIAIVAAARVVALASMHPVLGLSRGASVGWGR